MSSTSSSFSNESSSSGTPPRKMRNLNELYEVTNSINDVALYCHLATCEIIMFEEAINNVK
jgi:hypothetical protein